VTDLLAPICRCFGMLESDLTPMSVAYAALLFIFAHIRSAAALGSNERHLLETSLLRRWRRIYPPVHALAFVCDPLFFAMRRAVLESYGQDVLGLGFGDIMAQCRNALILLARGDAAKAEQLQQQFVLFVYSPTTDMESLRDFQPGLIWAQFAGVYGVLAQALLQIYKGPASTAGVERHHKYGKRVSSNLRGRLGEGKIERQVAIAYNFASLHKLLPLRRVDRFLLHLAQFGSTSSDNEDATTAEDVQDDETESIDGADAVDAADHDQMLRALEDFRSAMDINDSVLYAVEEDDSILQ
jgi:hypothetical protein